jgi:AcrR family transcriptional regulator
VPPPTGLFGRSRPGGRSARIRAKVLAAAIEVLDERGFEGMEVPEVARRAGVHPTTVYRRWQTRARLVGEALLERSLSLTPTPNTGSLRGDLEGLLRDGAAMVGTPAVRALFEVLLNQGPDAGAVLVQARERFWTAHLAEVRSILERASARGELASAADPAVVIDVLIGPALVRVLLAGSGLAPAEREELVERALWVLQKEARKHLGRQPPHSSTGPVSSATCAQEC